VIVRNPSVLSHPPRAKLACLFCLRAFEMLPFYGCCGACYQRSAEVRKVVDEAHPDTSTLALREEDADEHR